MMLDVPMMIWLFPVLFMIHDFEEIIMIKPWFTKNRERLAARFPVLSKILLSFSDSIATESLSLGIGGMFMMICAVTMTAYWTGWYHLWLGVFVAFTVHLLMHCVPGLIVKGYVPAILTSVICLPPCCYILVLFLQRMGMDFKQVMHYTFTGFVLFALSRFIVQIIMQRFSRWLNTYQNEMR